MFSFVADLFQKVLQKLNRIRSPHSRIFDIDSETVDQLRWIAVQENRAEDDVATDLLADGVRQHMETARLLESWNKLSRREQQMAAMAAMGYANSEIAERFSISQETVKSHLHNATLKFGLRSKHDLVRLLSTWDFTGWDQ